MSKAEEIKNKLSNQKTNAAKKYMEQWSENKNNSTKSTDSTEESKNKLSRFQDKQSIEDTHTRQTFLIQNDLAEELNDLSQKNKKGFKTAFINQAIESALNEYKK
ncbi:hypothetical protein ACKXGF_14350 (plasmid) [Alkalibacillus sp. S2W]|uniref:hypothetical protein n=1 Tax=Alkalibacillus sp. S2W TaxID=3386553 RepID=UPI00398CF4C9